MDRILSFVARRAPWLYAPAVLVINTLMLPVMILYVIPRVAWKSLKARHAAKAQTVKIPAEQQANLTFETVPRHVLDPEEELEQRAYQMAKAGAWDDLHDMMARHDRDRRYRGIYPMTFAISRGVRLEQAQAIDALMSHLSHPVNRLNTETLEWLEGVFAQRPNDHLIGAILARAHHEIAWAFRGCGYADEITEAGAQGFARHIARAREIIDRFDATELDSPFVAVIAHYVGLECDDVADRIQPLFDTAIKLDPKNLGTLQFQGFRLLPRWYGYDDTLELEARQAMADTPHMGAAAYMGMYFEALTEDAGALAQVDVGLFIDGALDMIRAHNGNQIVVNTLVQFAFDMSNLHFSAFGDEAERLNAKREEFEALFERILDEEMLLAQVPEVWDLPPHAVHQVMTQVYQKPLLRGDRVDISRKGVVITPAPTPPADEAEMVPA